MALRLGIKEETATMLRLAAQLHDLGKTAIADAVLLKPARLTDDEFEQMKLHTTIGADILADGHSPLIQLAREIALTHHERWEGGGYPLGMKGEAIPISGRIVAVADVFDALMNERPYKKKWMAVDAVHEIKKLSGKQFDPRVVTAFVDVISARQADLVRKAA
jgi:putative two-component system response regulator